MRVRDAGEQRVQWGRRAYAVRRIPLRQAGLAPAREQRASVSVAEAVDCRRLEGRSLPVLDEDEGQDHVGG